MTEAEWLNGNELSLDIWHKKYQVDNESFEQWLDRVSNKNEKIKKLIRDKKFLFAGRILANRKTGTGSMSNCYSYGFLPDSVDGLMNAAKDIALTFKAQGGQGVSFSKVRPRGALIKGKFESSGIIPFMEILNTVTGSIKNGEKRRGALMISLDVWHKDADDFITVKSDLQKINNANLSLEIDDRFMLDIAEYRSSDKTIRRTLKLEYGNGDTIQYDVMPVDLWKKICEQACKYAEPGILFTDRLRHYNMMQHHSEYKIETTNPCSEQPLPAHGCCNLCSINLGAYVSNAFTRESVFNMESFKEDIKVIVDAMDELIDENLSFHPLEKQREMAERYRNIGIGIMGLHDMFVKLGYKYGSPESIKMAENVMRVLFRTAVKESVKLAKRKGSFPGYESNVWDSDIIKEAFDEEEIDLLKKTDALRNCSLISIAPCGSIGTALQVSTGCEPYYALSYFRRSTSLDSKDSYYEVDIPTLMEYRTVSGNNDTPEIFNSAGEIPYKERIDMQAALQKYCDTAISSTINLPKGTTPEEIGNLYFYAWEAGLKGVTVYVDGSRQPILSKEKDGNKVIPKRPKELPCDINKIKVKGQWFMVCVGLLNGKPYEVFCFHLTRDIQLTEEHGMITKIKKGVYRLESKDVWIDNLLDTDINMEEKAATLYASMLLRHGVPVKYVIKTAKKVNQYISSFSSAMCHVLGKYVPKECAGECPQCGAEMIHESGCTHCTKCGYSRCGD